MASEISKIMAKANTSNFKLTNSVEKSQNGSIFGENSAADSTFSFGIEKTAPAQEAKAVDSAKLSKFEDIKDAKLLANAPSNKIMIAGEEKQARIVVSLKSNKLYLYDKDGNAEEVHSVASGAARTPTHKGIKKVSHIETYPYSTAGGTKRKKNPKAYGPKILILNTVDPKTGQNKGSNGEFIHGNSNEASIGKYASHGCVRMHNDQIVRMAQMVSPGSYVLIQD